MDNPIEKIQTILMENPWILGVGVLVIMALGVSIILSRPTVSPPKELTYTVDGYRVLLTWDPGAGEISSYVVLRGLNDDVKNAKQIATLSPNTFSYSDAPVEPGTYYYWVAVSDKRGNLYYSKPVEVVVKEVKPLIKAFYAAPRFTNNTLVILHLEAENVGRCRFHEIDHAWNSWMSPPTEMPWRLSDAPGTKVIEVECVDPFGLHSISARTDVVYDPDPPVINFTFVKTAMPGRILLVGDLEWEDATEVSCSLWYNGSLVYSSMPRGEFHVELPPVSSYLVLDCMDAAYNRVVSRYMINYTGRPEFYGYIIINNNESVTDDRDVVVTVYAPMAEKARCKDNASEDWTPWYEFYESDTVDIPLTLTDEEEDHTVVCEVVFYNLSFNLTGNIYYYRHSNNEQPRPFLRLGDMPRYTNREKLSLPVYWRICDCEYRLVYEGEQLVARGVCTHTLKLPLPHEGEYRLIVSCGDLREERPLIVDRSPPEDDYYEPHIYRVPGYVRVDYEMEAHDNGYPPSGLAQLCFVADGPGHMQVKRCQDYEDSGIVDLPVPADIEVIVSGLLTDRAGNEYQMEYTEVSHIPEPKIFVSKCGGLVRPSERITIKVWFGNHATISLDGDTHSYTLNPDAEWVKTVRMPSTPGRVDLEINVEGILENQTKSCSYTVVVIDNDDTAVVR